MGKSPQIKVFLFDIGGVLVSVDSSRAMTQLSRKLKVPPEQIRHAMTLQLLNKYERGELTSNQFYEEMLVACDSRCHMDLETFKTYWQDVLFPNADSIAFLERVTRDYPVWLLSNTNDFHYELLLQDFPFMQWVRGGTYSFIEGSIKPEPQIYLQAIAKCGYPAQEILFIDDLLANVLTGLELGINVIHYHDYGQFSRELRTRFPELGYLL